VEGELVVSKSATAVPDKETGPAARSGRNDDDRR